MSNHASSPLDRDIGLQMELLHPSLLEHSRKLLGSGLQFCNSRFADRLSGLPPHAMIFVAFGDKTGSPVSLH